MTKQLINVYIKEKYGKWYLVFYLIPAIILGFADYRIAMGLSFCMIIFTAEQIAYMFSAIEYNSINMGYFKFRKKKNGNIMRAAIFLTFPWLCVQILKIVLGQKKPWYYVIISTIIWIFLIVLGMMLGIVVKKEIISWAVIIVYFVFCLQKPLMHELYFRYISPWVILEEHINIFCLWGLFLAVITILMFLSMHSYKGKIGVICFYFLGIICITSSEVSYEKEISNNEFVMENKTDYIINYNDALNRNYVNHIAELICASEKVMQQYGFNCKTSVYNIKYSIYFPWEGSEEKVFIRKDGNMCEVNCYAEVMRNLSDEEIVTRYVYSVIKTKNNYQEAALDLFVSNIVSQITKNETSAYLKEFSYENLISVYGSCVSPKQCIAAECMLKEKDKFYRLYDALGGVNELKELKVDELFQNAEYKKIARRIIME